MLVRGKRLALILVLLLVLLTGCAGDLSERIDDAGWRLAESFHELVEAIPDGDNLSPDQLACSQIDVIFQSVLNQDAELLKSVLVPCMHDSDEIDNQIQSLFDFIDGDIVSYSDAKGYMSSEDIRYGKTTERFLSGWVNEIKTSTGREYLIRDSAVDVNSIFPDESGVYYIFVRDVTDGVLDDTWTIIGSELFGGDSLESVLGISLARDLYGYDADWKLVSDDVVEIWRWASYAEWPNYIMDMMEPCDGETFRLAGHNLDVLCHMQVIGFYNDSSIVSVETDDWIRTYRVTF